MRKVLFVCTGNTCRSPMAEAFLRSLCGSSVEVASAGLLTVDGLSASPLAVEVSREFGVDISGHRSSCLRDELVDGDTLLVGMSRSHVDVLLQRGYGITALGVHLFGELVGRGQVDVPDPFGWGEKEYRSVAALIWDWSNELARLKPWEGMGS
ncbi:low molecular weight protein arginine phosphatase [Thermanaerovibrio acidaminovorans]|jgi:protein-tyrosine-phosphatase|uniref:low molecular weight protein arginine phosphatase n=1 Tax=Thermanaerovibrio acidaminovorans TaxID=81462 RepID=UPI002492A912|nr:low molecular weight protein arginine phosphatase [Thermanaerovibrio acidaminovorans]